MTGRTAPKGVSYVQLRGLKPSSRLHLYGGGSDRWTLCGKPFEDYVARRRMRQHVCPKCIAAYFDYMEGIE